MTTIKRFLFTFIAAASLMLCITRPASANTVPVSTAYNANVDTGQTITDMFQSFQLPKFSASGSGGLTQHAQLHYVDQSQYNFVYFQLDKVCVLVIGHPCVTKYKIEVSYQIHDSSGFHDGFLSDYGYPGDEITWLYDETGGNGAAAEIVNDGSSGHGAWDHAGTWTWSGTHPVAYQEPHFGFSIDTGFGHNCLGDMPAQDTPHSTSHVSTLDYLGTVNLANGTKIAMPLRAVSPPVTSVSPTSCSISVTSFWDGFDVNYEMKSYGGG